MCVAELSFTFLAFVVSHFSTELADKTAQVPYEARKCIISHSEAKLKSRAYMKRGNVLIYNKYYFEKLYVFFKVTIWMQS